MTCDALIRLIQPFGVGIILTGSEMIHVDPNSKAAKVIMTLGVPAFAAALGWQLVCFCRAARSYSWPSTEGVVTASSVHDVHTEYGSSAEATIEYTYTVGGRAYHNDTVSFGLFRGRLTWGDAARKAREFPAGRAVRVFYDPRRPQLACLRRGGVGWEDLFMLVVGAFGVGFGIRQVGRFFRWLGPRGAGSQETSQAAHDRQRRAATAFAPRTNATGSPTALPPPHPSGRWGGSAWSG